jgi:hypothetical protein
LEAYALGKGCASTVIAPNNSEFAPTPTPERTELAFPRLAFSVDVPFSGYPTTLILNEQRQLIWEKVGALDTRTGRIAKEMVERTLPERVHGRTPVAGRGSPDGE